MKCSRSAHLDLAAFLAGESSLEIEAFRAHYPSCPDCSVEVRAWTELHAQLDPAPATGQHPSEDLLLQFESQPEKMSAVARSSVETHLKSCASCRDELRTLRGFDFSLLQRPATDVGRDLSLEHTTKPGWLQSILAPVRTILLHPAFAYGLVLLLLLPQIANLSPRVSLPPPAAQRQDRDERRPAAAPSAELAFKPGPARPDAERRDEPAADLADGGMPDRLREAQNPPAAFRAGGAYSVSPAEKDASDQPAAAKPAPLARRSREVDSLIAGQPPGGGFDETKEEGQSAHQQGAAKVFQYDSGKRDGDEQPLRRQIEIQMDRSGRNNIPMQGMLGGATLHIKPQQPVSPGGDVAIRIKSADGRRELREIHTASRDDGYLEMTVPPGWMLDGTYSIEVLLLADFPESSPHRH